MLASDPRGEVFVTTEEPMLVISADGHAVAPPETFRPYLERRYVGYLDDLTEESNVHRDLLRSFHELSDDTFELIDCDGAIRSGGIEGVHDVGRRLREMDREGIAAEIVIAGAQTATLPWFAHTNRPHPPELQAAGARAYNRWVADMLSEADGRLFAVGYPGPCLDVGKAVEAVRWLAHAGFHSITMPGFVEDEGRPSIVSPEWRPFWAAVADHGLVLSIHAGHGRPQGETAAFLGRLRAETSHLGRDAALRSLISSEGSPFALDLRPRRAVWQMMLNGAFDRNPDLRLVLTEVRGDWVPVTLRCLEQLFVTVPERPRRRPTEYWTEHCFVALSFIHRAEVEMRTEIGVEQMMFGRDYPHPEGTWPNTRDWIRHAFAGVDEPDARAILGLTAARAYRLDSQHLAEVAARIGPVPRTVLDGGRDLDDALVREFDTRGGYLRPAEDVDTSEIISAFQEDAELTAALSGSAP